MKFRSSRKSKPIATPPGRRSPLSSHPSIAAGVGLTSNVVDAPVLHRVMLYLLMWVFWATASFIVGVYLMPEPQTQTDVGELLRTIGFAASPGILRIFGTLPAVGEMIYGISTAWMVVAMVIAIRQALDYKSTSRAVVVCLITGVIGRARSPPWPARLSSCSRKRLYPESTTR